MTKRLHVVVTTPLIERATQRDSRHCMIAEAILASRPDLRNVMVDLATIRWTNPKTGKRYIALTPEVAGAELVNFDQGRPIEPFEFNIEAIQVTDVKKPVQAPDGEVERYANGKPKVSGAGRGGRRLTVSGGRPTVNGGVPLPMGHLAGGANARRPGAEAHVREPVIPVEAPEGSSNVVRSGRRFRQYGRRLLQG